MHYNMIYVLEMLLVFGGVPIFMSCGLITLGILWFVFSLIGYVVSIYYINKIADKDGYVTAEALNRYIHRKKYGSEASLRQFYQDCIENHCTKFSKEKNIARAKLIAEKYSLAYPDGIQALYNEAEKLCKEEAAIEAEKAEKERLHQMHLDEITEATKMVRYSGYRGRDKKVKMLSDKRDEFLRSAQVLEAGGKALVEMTQQRESSWAFWGGIADGLAGPGAGIATAMDVQASNSRIRAQNKANLSTVMPTYMTIMNGRGSYRDKAYATERLIEEAKLKLVSEMPAEEVLALLNITNPKVEVTDTGAYRVTATVEAKKKLTIFDDTPAVADGTIIAHVWEGKKEIGTAKMVLPIDGTAIKTSILGMGLSGADRKKAHTVTFTASNLWLMEQ